MVFRKKITERVTLNSLLIIALLSICLGSVIFINPFDGHPVLFSTMFWIYSWIPGVIALICSKIQHGNLKVKLSVNRYFWQALGSGFVIGATIHFLTAFLGGKNPFNFPSPSIVLFSFFSYYVIFFFIFFVLFLGGELYWRGYLWEKVKDRPFRGIWIVAGIWSIWMVPLTLFSVQIKAENMWRDLAIMFVYNFMLAPILLYFRIRGKSILTSVLFYASLQAASLFFQMLLPLNDTAHWVFQGARIICLILYCLIFNLYSSQRWERLCLKNWS